MQDRDLSDDTHTTDGVEITPGLWVWNNNLDSVQVDPKQFATDEDRARLFRQANPAATVYSEVWYEMLNGEGQRSSIMNGTRMATVFEGLLAADFPGKPYSEAKTFVAVVYDEDGTVYDHTWNWESAQNYALSEGRKIKAVKDDGSMTRREIQALCDAERERYRDCFGITD